MKSFDTNRLRKLHVLEPKKLYQGFCPQPGACPVLSCPAINTLCEAPFFKHCIVQGRRLMLL